MEWQNWIEEKLGICLPEAAILETRLNLAQIGVERILGLPGDQGDDSRTINCLDGVATGEEIVVIATANEPTALGPAILRRPGRFDRIVNFSNPSGALRRQCYAKINPRIDPGSLDQVVSASDGLSFAQLRETFILASQFAFQRDEDVTADDLAGHSDTASNDDLRIDTQSCRWLCRKTTEMIIDCPLRFAATTPPLNAGERPCST
jgi:hypothetical protein